MASTKISDMTSAVSVADADVVPIVQSGVNKKSAWSLFKSTLKTYFDTLYSPSSYAAIPRLSKTSLSAAHTGTTSNTYVDSLLIPANTYGAGTVFEVLSRVNKTTSVSTYTHRLYVNTTNNLSGSPILIATAATSAAANRFQQITRQVEIMVANGTGAGTEVMAATQASTQDDVQQTDMTTCAIDWTVNQYIICAIQLANGTDSINNHFIITR